MKKEQRLIYLEVVKAVDWCLCSFCKFQYYSSACSGGDSYCEHPIEKIAENDRDAQSGDDCWGFRPNLPLNDIADIVGIILSENFDPEKTMYYEPTDKEPAKVMGYRRAG